MVVSAASLLGSRGVGATSLADVLAASRAPRGSIYHHFPGGKSQLIGEAMRWTTEQVLAYQEQCAARTAPGVLGHFVDLFRHSIASSQCQAGCPIAGVVVGSSSEDGKLLLLGREGFRAWADLLTRQLIAVRVPPRNARSLAVTTLASVEGALILCRAERSLEPLEQVAEQLRLAASTAPKKR